MIYGARPSPFVAEVPDLLGLIGTSAPPADVSLVAYVDRIRNQRQSSKCVGESLAAALHIAGKAQGLHASPRGIWTGARVRERLRSTDILVNTGCAFADAIDGCMRMGVRPEDELDDDDAATNDEDALDELEKCVQLPREAFASIAGVDAALGTRAALLHGWPVSFATMVDQSFEDYDGTAGAWDGIKGPVLGGHAMVVVGAYSSGDFLICNSWGVNFGFGGFARFTESALRQCFDVYAVRQGANL